jgi:hypothetical protein
VRQDQALRSRVSLKICNAAIARSDSPRFAAARAAISSVAGPRTEFLSTGSAEARKTAWGCAIGVSRQEVYQRQSLMLMS